LAASCSRTDLIPLAADSLVRAETAIEELWATDQEAAS
jgi:hypothetical protein